MDMELPIKGKDVIALCSDGQERHLFRCACTNEKCKEWRCAITGVGIIVEVVKWAYNTKTETMKKRYDKDGKEVDEPNKKYKGGGNSIGCTNQLTKEYANYLDSTSTPEQMAERIKELQSKNQVALKNLIELRDNFLKCNIPVGGINEVIEILQTKQNQEG